MDWLSRILGKLRSMFTGKDRKKTIDNAVIVIIIGIIIVIAGSTFWKKSENKSTNQIKNEDTSVQAVNNKVSDPGDSSEAEKRIEKVLSQIEGVGKVTVLITYASGRELVTATEIKKTANDTDEKDNGGGTRSINQDDYESKIAFEEEQGGSKKPVIIKEILPEVKGVVVVADGASDPQVKESLSRAVCVLTGVPSHKIQVFARSK